MIPGTYRTRGVVVCIAAIVCVTVTLGVSWPLLALVLAGQGVSPWLNGLSASAQMAAVLAVAPLGPPLIGRLGTLRVIALGIATMAVALILLTLFVNVWAWFPIRFLLGLASELVFACGDVWINQLADRRTRGRLIGIYGTFAHGGFAIGPTLLMVFGTEEWTALYVVVGLVLIGLLLLPLARGSVPPIHGKPRARLLHFLRAVPTLMVAGLIYGLIESATFALLPLYGLAKGLDESAAAFLLTMFVVGAVAGQVPVGWLADHVERRRLMACSVSVSLLAFALLPAAIGHTGFTWVAMVLMGMTLGSFFVIAMAMIGARFSGADLVGVNASFIFLWGIGAVAGPALGGGAFAVLGPDGLPALGVALCAGFLALIVWRLRTAPGAVDG